MELHCFRSIWKHIVKQERNTKKYKIIIKFIIFALQDKPKCQMIAWTDKHFAATTDKTFCAQPKTGLQTTVGLKPSVLTGDV